MAVLSATLTFLLLITSQLSFAQSQDSPGGCKLTLNRLFGRVTSYVYACNCPLDGRLSPVARAEAPIPSTPQETAAQASATTRCILNEEARLLSLCENAPRMYDIEAKATMEHCLSAPTTAKDRELKGAFSFRTEGCVSNFATFFGAETATVWFCRCKQDAGYFVVRGRSAFITDGSPLGAKDEVDFVRKCAESFLDSVTRVCISDIEDYEVFTLHLLQVCCKRARVRFRREKFACRALVPDDLTPFLALK